MPERFDNVAATHVIVCQYEDAPTEHVVVYKDDNSLYTPAEWNSEESGPAWSIADQELVDAAPHHVQVKVGDLHYQDGCAGPYLWAPECLLTVAEWEARFGRSVETLFEGAL